MIFAYGCTESWYKYLVVNIFSLLESNPHTKKIYLLVETENIDDIPYLKELKNDYNVEFVLVDYNKIKDKYITDSNPNIETKYTDFAFCKLILADVVKEDKVIYLDIDTVVTNDLYRLWFWDLGDNMVGGCSDTVLNSIYFRDNLVEIGENGKYINTGVMLMDLVKFRKTNMISKMFELLNNRELKFPDQDALNIACQGHIQYIPSIYNQACSVTIGAANIDEVKVWHMARTKVDWLANIPYSEYWYLAEEKFFFKYVHKEK